MLNFKTGRFFVGDGNILYPAMRKKEFFQTNFFKNHLIEEKGVRDLEEYHVKGHILDNIILDIDIKFDVVNDFILNLVLRANDLDGLLQEVGVKKDSSIVYCWGNVENKDDEIKITFNNEKFIR